MFSSILGRLVSTINGTKNLPCELQNNLELIENSSFLLDTYCTSSSLYPFMSELHGYKTNSFVTSKTYPIKKPTKIIDEDENRELLLKFGAELSLYSKCVIQGATVTTFNYSKSKQFQDCAVLYRRGSYLYLDISNKIIFIKNSDNLLLQIFPFCENKKDEVLLNFNTKKLSCDHVEFGKIDFNRHVHINADDFIEKVCYYQFGTKFIFIRYPILTESS